MVLPIAVESSPRLTPRDPMLLPLVDRLCLQMRRNVPMLNSSSPTPLRSTLYVIPASFILVSIWMGDNVERNPADT